MTVTETETMTVSETETVTQTVTEFTRSRRSSRTPDPGFRIPAPGLRNGDRDRDGGRVRDRDRIGLDAMMHRLRAKRAVGVRRPCLRPVSRAERAGLFLRRAPLRGESWGGGRGGWGLLNDAWLPHSKGRATHGRSRPSEGAIAPHFRGSLMKRAMCVVLPRN